MRAKPVIFDILAIFFMGVAISFPIQVMLMDELGLNEWKLIWSKMTVLNWTVIACCGLNATLAFRASKFLKITLPLSFLAVAFNNWLVSAISTNVSEWTTLFATVSFMLISSIFIVTEDGRLAVNNPSKHWWKTSPRNPVNLPAWINGQDSAITHNISKSGAFFSWADGKIPGYLHPGDTIKVMINTPDGVSLDCEAQVMRKVHAKGEYPEGLGVRFTKMNLGDKRIVNRIVEAA